MIVHPSLPLLRYHVIFCTKLIHSANPQSRAVVIIVFEPVSVRNYIAIFQYLAKQNKFQEKTMFTSGETVGLAEWIIFATKFLLFSAVRNVIIVIELRVSTNALQFSKP